MRRHVYHETLEVATETDPNLSNTQVKSLSLCSEIHNEGMVVLDDFSANIENSSSSSNKTDVLFDLFLEADKIQSSEIIQQNNHTTSIDPCTFLPNQPFSHFSLDTLDEGINFDKTFGNRSTLYYGEQTYSYSNIRHPPKPIPTSGYIHEILKHLDSVLPNFNYNSVLLT